MDLIHQEHGQQLDCGLIFRIKHKSHRVEQGKNLCLSGNLDKNRERFEPRLTSGVAQNCRDDHITRLSS